MKFRLLGIHTVLSLASTVISSSSSPSSTTNDNAFHPLDQRSIIRAEFQSWNPMREFEDGVPSSVDDLRMREFEDIQSKFSLDRRDKSSTASSSTATSGGDEEGGNNKPDDDGDKESAATSSLTGNRNANGGDTQKQSLQDAWMPPYWNPEKSMVMNNSTRKSLFLARAVRKDKEDEEEESKEKDNQEDDTEQKTDETSEGQSETNTTKTEKVPTKENTKKAHKSKENPNKPEQQRQEQQQQQERPRIIVMGGPMGPGGMGGGGGGPQMTPQQQLQQQQQMRKTATSLAAAEVLISVVGNSLRLWFLLWASRHIANRQESVMPTQHFVFERLNDKFIRDTQALKTALLQPPIGVSKFRWNLIMNKRSRKKDINNILKLPNLEQTFFKTAIVVEVGHNSKGDLDLKYLSDVATFLISQHRAQAFGSVSEGEKDNDAKPVDLEIIFKIDSPGGSVAAFGLAAAQVERLRRETGIVTTVCVDKYAASGGYMIASQADRLIAAPFATVGSVGVIVETLNFHDILKQYGVQPMVIKAGNAKNPLTMYGPVTKRDLEQEEVRLSKVHEEFQRFTIQGRPQLKGKEDEVCNGSIYIGREALQLNLVDVIMTSEEYLMGRIEDGVRVLKIQRSKQSMLPAHVRFPSPVDVLPHLLKSRLGPLVQSWVSDPEIVTKVVKAGSVLGFLHHLFSRRFGMPPSP